VARNKTSIITKIKNESLIYETLFNIFIGHVPSSLEEERKAYINICHIHSFPHNQQHMYQANAKKWFTVD
jgi:hypothetical protein